jgi:hypothetical protein
VAYNLAKKSNKVKTWEIALDEEEKEIVHVKRCSQEVFVEIGEQVSGMSTENVASALATIGDLVLKVLNNNVEKHEFTKEWLAEQGYDIFTQVEILQDYFMWCQGVLANPN